MLKLSQKTNKTCPPNIAQKHSENQDKNAFYKAGPIFLQALGVYMSYAVEDC